jgi:hypothetical protein
LVAVLHPLFPLHELTPAQCTFAVAAIVDVTGAIAKVSAAASAKVVPITFLLMK